MSRVIYADTQATPEQLRLREAHNVHPVSDAEEGLGVDKLPRGVYGFTYSPALANAPLFATRRFRAFETHKLTDGEVVLIGLVSVEEAAAVSSSAADIEVRLQPEPEAGVDVLVVVPYSRIRHHRQYAVRTEHGLSLTVGPA